MSIESNQAEAADGTKCARCGRKCNPQELIQKICPACKRICQSAHGDVLKPGFKEKPDRWVRTIKPQGWYDDSGERVTSTADMDDGEGMIQRYCEERGCNWETALMDLEVAARVLPTDRSKDDIREQVNQKWQELMSLFTRGWVVKQGYEKRHGNRILAERCLFLLLNMKTLAGAEDLAGLVRLTNLKKQTVNKCLRFFQEMMPELPELPGQRDSESRQNMANARVEQIEKNTNL